MHTTNNRPLHKLSFIAILCLVVLLLTAAIPVLAEETLQSAPAILFDLEVAECLNAAAGAMNPDAPLEFSVTVNRKDSGMPDVTLRLAYVDEYGSQWALDESDGISYFLGNLITKKGKTSTSRLTEIAMYIKNTELSTFHGFSKQLPDPKAKKGSISYSIYFTDMSDETNIVSESKKIAEEEFLELTEKFLADPASFDALYAQATPLE